MESLPRLVKREIDRAIHDNPGAVVGLLDLKGVILYVSPSLKHVLGYSPEDEIGRKISEFMMPDDAPHTRMAIQDAILMGEVTSAERRLKTKDGGFRTMRGPGRLLVDYETGGEYILSISHPID